MSQGSWIWYELMTPDPEGSRAFYEAVAGWTISTGHGDDANYGFIANPDGAMTGGMLALTAEMRAQGARPRWIGYVAVDDVEIACARVAELGGRVLMPKVTIEVGSFALVMDCCGAMLYLMTPQGEGESTAFSPSLVGRCGWNELRAGDADAALAFYGALFGWRVSGALDMGPLGPYRFLNHGAPDHGDTVISAVMKNPAPTPPHWNHYFRVADIDVALAAINAGGGTLVTGPDPVPTGDWTVQAIDPQGASFCLVGRRAG